MKKWLVFAFILGGLSTLLANADWPEKSLQNFKNICSGKAPDTVKTEYCECVANELDMTLPYKEYRAAEIAMYVKYPEAKAGMDKLAPADKAAASRMLPDGLFQAIGKCATQYYDK